MLLLFCRQLSSLSQHAEDMFRELFVEATTIFERTCNLSNKVDSLRDSVQQFDPNQVVGKFLIFSWFFMISGTAVLDWLSVLSSTQQKGLRVSLLLSLFWLFLLLVIEWVPRWWSHRVVNRQNVEKILSLQNELCSVILIHVWVLRYWDV